MESVSVVVVVGGGVGSILRKIILWLLLSVSNLNQNYFGSAHTQSIL